MECRSPFFDFYERTLLNHRLPAINRKTGATQYYLSVFPHAWKTFNTANDSFWCCTGSGVEEFAKLNDSIYFHGADGLFVNLFIPSELRSKTHGLSLRQETKFPEGDTTTLVITAAPSEKMPIHLRIPSWVGSQASVQVNGESANVIPAPGSYYTLDRAWKKGDRISLHLPMQLRIEAMPDDPTVVALCYGPLVLAGQFGSDGLTKANTIGPEGPEMKAAEFELPKFQLGSKEIAAAIEANEDAPLTFRAPGEQGHITLRPLYQTFDTRYSVYWRLT